VALSKQLSLVLLMCALRLNVVETDTQPDPGRSGKEEEKVPL
jgi:hypothetical protein